MSDITNNDDTIDIRDVRDEINELESQIADLQEQLTPLKRLAEEVNDDGPLIRESYFTEYAQQLAEDLGAISANAPWPACHIDWDAAAEELKMDYSTVDFDGVTYYYRA
jgi:chromosome segregation ATPase